MLFNVLELINYLEHVLRNIDLLLNFFYIYVTNEKAKITVQKIQEGVTIVTQGFYRRISMTS